MAEVIDDEDKKVKLLLECNCVKEAIWPHTCHMSGQTDSQLYIMMVTTMYAHSTLITYYYT